MIKFGNLSFGRFDYAAFVTYFSYAAGSVIIPVALVSLAQDLGFSLDKGGMNAGGALHLGRSIAIMISMLACGFIAGQWGKRLTFGWSVIGMGAGMAMCAVAPSYGVLFLALMVAGIGEGVIEGLGTPFVQALHKEEPGKYINFSHGFWSVGVLVTVLAAGALLSIGVSWRLLTGCVAAFSAVPVIMLMSNSKRSTKYPEHPEVLHWTTVARQAKTIMRLPRFWVFFAAMFLAGGGEFCLTFWSASYIQLKFSSSAWAGGLGTAFFAAGMASGRTGWPHIVNQKHLNRLIVFSAIAGTIVTICMPMADSERFLFGLLFLAGVATAPFWPSLQSYCADCLPETDTTMLFVLLSCAGIPGCGFFTWLMGWIGNSSGLGAAFYIVPACYAGLAVLAGYAWKKQKKQNQILSRQIVLNKAE